MNNRFNLILSPLFLISLCILFLNDFILKDLYPGLITGKLSDFAGLIVFTTFIYFLIGKWKKHIFLVSALLFIFWKSSLSTGIIEFSNSLLPLTIGRVIDYTDLIALLILPITYFYNPKKVLTIKKPILKYTLILFTLFSCIASEVTDIKFKNKVKGVTPYELQGDYIFQYTENDKLVLDPITFIRIKKSSFLILENLKDTLYLGQIKRRKGDYYLFKFDKETEYWEINSFRIDGDSIYNFENSFWGLSDKEFVKASFELIEIEKKDDDETWFVNNTKKETLKAFDQLLNNSKGYFFTEIIQAEDTIFEEIQLQEDIAASIPNESSFAIKAYPNPVIDQLIIEHRFKTSVKAAIINTSGQIMQRIKVEESPLTWNLEALQKGVYTILFYTDKTQSDYSIKIIKK